MWLTSCRKKCVQLDHQVVRRLLSFYPEEQLAKRPRFAEAIQSGAISLSALKAECELNFIPWQMFLLNNANLSVQLENIEKNRADRLSKSFFSRRSGKRGAFSMRIIDRYVRLQNFMSDNSAVLPDNKFNGSLLGRSARQAAEQMTTLLGFDLNEFRKKPNNTKALEYFIARASSCQINIARATTAHGLMPSTDNHMAIYKNMSGFCLRDNKIPFIYISTNEITGEEVVGRQIYTLSYLLALIGLNVYSYAVNSSRIIRVPGEETQAKLANDIASQLLLLESDLQPYRGVRISWDHVKELSLKSKMTPRAILFRLKSEAMISPEDHDLLLNANKYVPKKQRTNTPHIETSVAKLTGNIVFNEARRMVSSDSLKPIQAQMIFFGKPDMQKWRTIKANLKL